MTDLGPGNSGADVVLLHADLQRLGLPVADDERAALAFGPSTAAAVAQFQVTQGLPATGTLTPDTAHAMAAAASVVVNPVIPVGPVVEPTPDRRSPSRCRPYRRSPSRCLRRRSSSSTRRSPTP